MKSLKSNMRHKLSFYTLSWVISFYTLQPCFETLEGIQSHVRTSSAIWGILWKSVLLSDLALKTCETVREHTDIQFSPKYFKLQFY